MGYSRPTNQYRDHNGPDDLVKVLPEVMKRLLGKPNPKHSKPLKPRYGTNGSLSIDLQKGVWFDHESDEGGGVLELVMRELRCSTAAAWKWLRDEGLIPNVSAATSKSNIVAEYDYRTASGELAYQVVRFDPKKFVQRRKVGGEWMWNLHGVQTIPYRLPELLQAVEKDDTIFICEGEKDVEALVGHGFIATCNSGGAGKWKREYSKFLEGANRVVTLPDNDDAGVRHARCVRASLEGIVDDVRIIMLPNLKDNGDVTEWLLAGGSASELRSLVENSKQAPISPIRDRDWQSGLIRKENGLAHQNIGNVLHVIRDHPEWDGVIGLNELTGRRVLLKPIPGTSDKNTPRDLHDNDAINGAAWFNKNGFPSIGEKRVHSGLTAVAAEQPFHPVRDYLTSLVWDGQPRLDTWLERLGDVIIKDEKHRNYVAAVGSKMLISAVARIVRPGSKVDTVLILEGPQGAGKSSALRILAGSDHFGDALPDLGQKDARDYIRGKWIIELSELAALKKSEVEQVKAFISRQEERYRPAYGREEVVYQRQAVFCGTTNNKEFLRDDTGNRRFWPVSITSFSLEQLKAERDQLWAEAVQRFESGEKWWLDDEEIMLANLEQSERTIGDEWAEPIACFLGKLGSEAEVTVNEVADKALKIKTADLNLQSQKRIRSAMKSLGWTSSRRQARTGRTLFKRGAQASHVG